MAISRHISVQDQPRHRARPPASISHDILASAWGSRPLVGLVTASTAPLGSLGRSRLSWPTFSSRAIRTSLRSLKDCANLFGFRVAGVRCSSARSWFPNRPRGRLFIILRNGKHFSTKTNQERIHNYWSFACPCLLSCFAASLPGFIG